MRFIVSKSLLNFRSHEYELCNIEKRLLKDRKEMTIKVISQGKLILTFEIY